MKLLDRMKMKVYKHLDKQYGGLQYKQISIDVKQSEIKTYGTTVEIPLNVMSGSAKERENVQKYADDQAANSIAKQLMDDGIIQLNILEDYSKVKRIFVYQAKVVVPG